jgi:hypothetical protein
MGAIAQAILGRYPIGTQRRVLCSLLHTAADTEWGRRFGFADILRQSDTIAAFQQRVPLHRYEAFEEDHRRVLAGAANVCWPGRFRYLATTAGTLSRGRLLPASEATIRNDLRFGRAAVLNYLAETGRTECLRGSLLSLPGRVQCDPRYPGVLIGDMTGCLADYCLNHNGPLRRRLARSRIPPDAIRNLADYDAKAAAIADHMLDRDVRMMVMMPSWGLTLVEQILGRYNARHGTHVQTLGEIWPKLELVIAGGVPLQPYRRMLQERIGLPDVDFLETYSASEASFAFQSSRSDPALLLHLDNGVFYEFVRMDEAASPNPRRYTVADVEPGIAYLVVVSTCSGLWAYHMEDVVRFTQVFPHKLLVAGRMGELLDSVGEFLFAEDVRGAIRHACLRTGAEVRECHLAPRPTEPGRQHAHQWLLEFDRPPESLDRFGCCLDEYLQGANPSYAATRQKHGIGPPELIALPSGLFRQWLKRYRGHVIGQTKVPLMSESREMADSMLELAGDLAGIRGV